ncbi:MAG: T9SS type A sorting domain-containing protein [Saprospiraceae bacterium]
MISKLFFHLAFLVLLNASCNKVIEEVPLPPFDVFPNPCKDHFFIAINPVFFAGETITVKLLDGKEILIENTLSASDGINVNMSGREAGIYHVEVTGKGQTFIAPVLKVD